MNVFLFSIQHNIIWATPTLFFYVSIFSAKACKKKWLMKHFNRLFFSWKNERLKNMYNVTNSCRLKYKTKNILRESWMHNSSYKTNNKKKLSVERTKNRHANTNLLLFILKHVTNRRLLYTLAWIEYEIENCIILMICEWHQEKNFFER